MKTQMLLGASVLALTLGVSAANAQTVVIDGDVGIPAGVPIVGGTDLDVDLSLDATPIVDAITGDIADQLADLDIAGGNLSDTLGGAITNAIDGAAGGAVISAAVNSASIDSSVTATANAIDLSGTALDLLDTSLGLVGGVEGGLALGGTDDTLSVAALVDLGLDADVLGSLVEGGMVDIDGAIETVAVGASNSAQVAIAGVSASSDVRTVNNITGAVTSDFDFDGSSASVALNGNTSSSSAFEFDGSTVSGPVTEVSVRTQNTVAGIQDDLFATNLAFNNGFINSSVNLDGLGVNANAISTTAIGASNSGSLSVGYDGAALNSALNQTITVGGDE